ncbi:MAG TPA: T9SS type A sorting domain-containing protein [Flavobacteriales bacterium]|nr:T9SS type A sorting domain-containing protein [Flavobacteriales bacterium]
MRRSFYLLALFASVVAQAQELVPAWGGSMGAGGSDASQGIALDDAGHVYITGTFTGTTDMDPGPGVHELISAGSNDIYVAKFDTSGLLIWAKGMGGAYSDGATSIALDASGNAYITGGFCGTADFDPGVGEFELTAATTGENDIFIAKLDADGNFVWAKGIVGGTWWDAGYGIAVDPAGDVVITGRFYYQGGPRDFDPGPGVFLLTAGHEDIFVLKLEADGDFVWAVAFGTAPDESRGYSIAVDGEANIYVTGYFRGAVDFDPGPGTVELTSVGTWNVFYLKLDPDAALLWAKALPISTATYHNEGNYGRKIAVDAAGDLLATGRYSGTVDFDPGAGTTELTATGAYDLYVTKYSATGELVWARSMGGSGHDEGSDIRVGTAGDVLVAGMFQGTADLDPGSGTLELVAAGAEDAFILHLDSDGDLVHATSMGGPDTDRAYAVEMSTSGALYVTGWFAGTTDLDPGSGMLNATSAGSNDVFLIKLVEEDHTGMDEHALISASAIGARPNPASDRTTLLLDASTMGKRGVIEVFDATGERVHSEHVNALGMSQQLELSSSWTEGMYLVIVRVDGQPPKTARMIIQR